MINILFLGTSSMVPTHDRNQPAILLSYKDEKILIDCGEGTQRQLRLAGISPAKITRILITHWHGDHIFGLPGLIQTLQSSEYNRTLKIYGPINSKKYLDILLSAYIARDRIKVEVNEIKSTGIFLKEKEFALEAAYLNHSSPCLGYSFSTPDTRKINLEYTKKYGLVRHPLLGQLQRGKSITYEGKKIDVKKATLIKPGKKIAIILDTGMHANCIKLARNADLLVCESTYPKELEEKAREYKHLTSEQAALIAKKANAKQLILTHFSQRYKSVEEIEKEAKNVFKNVRTAKDFMTVNV